MAASVIQAFAPRNEPLIADESVVGRLVSAILRIRDIDRLEGAVATRCWLAADMRVSLWRLDSILEMLRRQGLIGLPNDHLVTVEKPDAIRAIALDVNA